MSKISHETTSRNEHPNQYRFDELLAHEAEHEAELEALRALTLDEVRVAVREGWLSLPVYLRAKTGGGGGPVKTQAPALPRQAEGRRRGAQGQR